MLAALEATRRQWSPGGSVEFFDQRSMSEETNANNPYAPPEVDADWLVMRRRTFRVGREEIHTVIVETSLARGLKTHTVDASGNPTPTQRGPCRFDIGEREEHEVEVKLDEQHRVNLLVDGRLVEGNLFPRMRATIYALVAVYLVVLTVAAVIGVFLVVTFLDA